MTLASKQKRKKKEKNASPSRPIFYPKPVLIQYKRVHSSTNGGLLQKLPAGDMFDEIDCTNYWLIDPDVGITRFGSPLPPKHERGTVHRLNQLLD